LLFIQLGKMLFFKIIWKFSEFFLLSFFGS
jgi:hypothetical protein